MKIVHTTPIMMRRMALHDRLNGKAGALVIKMNLENEDNEVAVSAAFFVLTM
ncbi:hypothetical protein NDS46_14575 [Paenibacillus thiaminolyticus]|uniref:hypothetical protein n=1 Tax=Paenibacillus thiaminolyticus TaxID=49283 RepID=UPI00232BCF7E|nr:hypothetical protein [Paenibacillus thiaminolyticus]WCF10992.1 hypothetical protein NDS46_14575 [Paenibacillus thiaminolyticus]